MPSTAVAAVKRPRRAARARAGRRRPRRRRSSMNAPRHHAPIDIGERVLKIRNMFRKRSGRPRSMISSGPPAPAAPTRHHPRDPGRALVARPARRRARRTTRRWRSRRTRSRPAPPTSTRSAAMHRALDRDRHLVPPRMRRAAARDLRRRPARPRSACRPAVQERPAAVLEARLEAAHARALDRAPPAARLAAAPDRRASRRGRRSPALALADLLLGRRLVAVAHRRALRCATSSGPRRPSRAPPRRPPGPRPSRPARSPGSASRPARAARSAPAARSAGRTRPARPRAGRRPRRPRRTGTRVSTPRSCSSTTRRFARSTSSSYGPNWIESVGHAFAHAGSMPVLQAVVTERALGGAPVVGVAAR